MNIYHFQFYSELPWSGFFSVPLHGNMCDAAQAPKTRHTSIYFQSPFPTNSPSAECREQFARHRILSTQSTINFVQVSFFLFFGEVHFCREGPEPWRRAARPEECGAGQHAPMTHDTSASQQTNRTPSCWFCKVQTIAFVRTGLTVFTMKTFWILCVVCLLWL